MGETVVWMTRKLKIVFLVFAMNATALAEEIRNPYLPIRAAGMGGAFTAVANDEGSIFTNPAGIARARKNRSRDTLHLAKFPNVIVGANAESKSFYQAFSSIDGDKNVEGVLDELDSIGTKPFWARAAIFPVMIVDLKKGTPASFGLFSETTTKIVIEEESSSQARVEVVSDQGAAVGIGWTNKTNRFNMGLQVRPTYRYAYEKRISSGDLFDKDLMKERLENDSNKSTATGIDFGMMATLADFWFPTIGVSVLNLPVGCRDDYLNPFTEKRETVCGTVYQGDFGNEDALSTVDPTDIRVGFSIITRMTRKINLRFALDAHNLAFQSGTSNYGLGGIEVSKMLHAGVELFVGNPLLIPPISFRSGYSQGFATFGVSLNLKLFSIDVASYGTDVSSSDTPNEDRRYMASITFGM
jgi:hypothetical protein